MSAEDEALRILQAELARCLTQPSIPFAGRQVQSLHKPELDQSRETLVRKRMSQTRDLLPRTAALLDTSFYTSFREFAIGHHFNGPAAISKDAIAFSKWLSTNKMYSPWIGQLAQWESVDCHWPTGKTFIRFFRFEYDFATPVQMAEPPKKRTSFWCCVRCFGWFRKIRLLGRA